MLSSRSDVEDEQSMDLVIGLAAMASVLLVVATIFVGYWITTRQRRPRAPLEIPVRFEKQPGERPPEAPRKAGRYSVPLSISSTSSDVPPLPPLPDTEKPLPSRPSPRIPPPLALHYSHFAAANVMSSKLSSSHSRFQPSSPGTFTFAQHSRLLSSPSTFNVTPMSAAFPAEKIPITPASPVVSLPVKARPGPLRLVRMLSTTKPPAEWDIEGGQAYDEVSVEQAVDSGVRLGVPTDGTSVVVPPPYSAR